MALWETASMSLPGAFDNPAARFDPRMLPAAAAGRLRPLAELPAARLARLRGVLTDIDDTLTRDGAIEPAALAALRRLAAAGVPVIAITGRPAGWSEPFALAWPVAAIVAENGAVMLRRQGEALRVDFVDDADQRAANQRRLQACAQAVLAEVPGATLAQDSAGRLTDIAIDHSEFNHLDAAQIERVVAVMRAHGLTATISSIHVNGWIGSHGKPSGARWAVGQALGLAFVADDWVYVGDSTNDQSMFEALPLSVGVANIARFVPQLLAFPGYVTPGERGVGFAELADALLAARSTGSSEA
jgi:HAD superfamily hydrolase (TIGR01484 family)